MSSESASAPRKRGDRAMTAEEEDGDESEDSSLWECDREAEREHERERKRQREAERTLARETERERERERDRERKRRDRDRRDREHDREHHRDRDREREDHERNSIDLTAEAPPKQSEGLNADVSDATPPLAMRVGAQSITDDVNDNDCEIKASGETPGIKPEAHDLSAPAPAPAAVDSMSVPHRASNREAQRVCFSRAFAADSDDSDGSDEYDEWESDSDSSGRRDGSDDSNDDSNEDDDDDHDGDDNSDDAEGRHQTLDVHSNIDESGADSPDGSDDVDSDNEDIIDDVDDNGDADADISANDRGHDRDVGTDTPERSNSNSQLTSSSMASMLSLILSQSSNPVPNMSESVRTPALQNGGPLHEDVVSSKAAPSTSGNDTTHRGAWLLRAYIFVLACGVLVAFGLFTASHYDKVEPLRAATRVLWNPTRNFIPGCKIYAPKCSAMPERGGSPFLEREPVLPLALLSGWTINSTRTATALSCAKAAKSWHIACNNLVSEPVWSSFLDGTAPVFRYPPPQSGFNITAHAKSIGVCSDAKECSQIGDCLRDAGFVEEHLRTPDGFRDRLRRCLLTLKQRLIWSKHVRFPHPVSWTPWRAGQARHAPTF